MTRDDWFRLIAVTWPLWVGVIVLALAGCASAPAPLPVRGDAGGGIIDTRGWHPAEAHEAVKAHCARYGKRHGPPVLSGRHVAFACV